MEQTYWLGRKRASAANARIAGSSEARLAHLELAGRYSVKAAGCAPPAPAPAPSAEPRVRLELRQSEAGEPDSFGRVRAAAVWLARAGGDGGDGGDGE
ncbi:MAG TPA: hypothetical protein VF759_13025 [Allosphingosinicella sp.]|jgi:hypothetical protein